MSTKIFFLLVTHSIFFDFFIELNGSNFKTKKQNLYDFLFNQFFPYMLYTIEIDFDYIHQDYIIDSIIRASGILTLSNSSLTVEKIEDMVMEKYPDYVKSIPKSQR